MDIGLKSLPPIDTLMTGITYADKLILNANRVERIMKFFPSKSDEFPLYTNNLNKIKKYKTDGKDLKLLPLPETFYLKFMDIPGGLSRLKAFSFRHNCIELKLDLANNIKELKVINKLKKD